MMALAERLYTWAIFLAGLTFILFTIGFEWSVFEWLPWTLLAAAAGSVVWMIVQTGGVNVRNNRLRRYIVGWLIGTAIALVLYSFAQKGLQDAVPYLKSMRKMWNVFEPFALFVGGLFVIFAGGLAVVGTKYSALDRPGHIERIFVSNLSAKIAAVPMAFTAIGVFVIATLWTIYHSFTNSKLLPKSELIGFDQSERIWSTERWFNSIENLAIYGFF